MTSQSANVSNSCEVSGDAHLVKFSFEAKQLRQLLNAAQKLSEQLSFVISKDAITTRAEDRLWIEVDLTPNHIAAQERETAFAFRIDRAAFSPIAISASDGLVTVSILEAQGDTPGQLIITFHNYVVTWPYELDFTSVLWSPRGEEEQPAQDEQPRTTLNPIDLNAALLLASPLADDTHSKKGFGTIEISNGTATSAGPNAMRSITHATGLGPDFQLEKQHLPTVSRVLKSIGTNSIEVATFDNEQIFSSPGLRMSVPRPEHPLQLAPLAEPQASFKVDGQEFLECIYIIGAQRKGPSSKDIRIFESLDDEKFALTIPVNGGEASIKCGYTDRTVHSPETDTLPQIDMSVFIKGLRNLSPPNGTPILLDFTSKAIVVHQSMGEHTFATSIGKTRD